MFYKYKAVILCYLCLMCFGKTHAQHTLQDYIDKAKSNSPLLHDNLNQAKVNELEIERLKAQYTKPQVGVTANYLFAPIISKDGGRVSFKANEYAADNYYGYDLAASNGGTYQGLINYSQPLFNKSSYKAYANQADVQKHVNENTAKLTGHDIEKFVTDQYVLCLLDKEQMLFIDTMMQLLKEQLAIVTGLVENGIMKNSDITLLNIEYKNNNALYTQYQATYRRDLMDLNVLCSIDDTTMVLLDNIELQIAQGPDRSAYLEKYRLDSMTVLATQKVFETKYKPQVSLYSNAGLNAVYAPTIPNRLGFSAGLSFTWNFFDGGQKSISRDKTDLQLHSISSYKNSFIKQNNVRKNKILAEIRSYNERKVIAKQMLDDYRSLLISYKKEVIHGQLPIINYITALKNMVAARRDYNVMNTNKLLLINAYNYWNW